jgi:WD40 repeat protein
MGGLSRLQAQRAQSSYGGAADGALLRTLTGHDGDVNGVAFSPNGSYVASAGSDGTVRVWRTQDGRLLHTLVGEGGIVLSVAFSPDSQLVASGSEDGRVKLWRVSTGALERTIPAHDLWVSSVAFSPSGGVLASASADGTVKLWQVANGQPVGDIQAHALWVTHIAFSPDGQLLASAGEDGTVKLWRVSDRQLVRTLSYSDAAPVYGVAFSADGSLVAAGGGANYISKMWRVSDGTVFSARSRGTPRRSASVAFAPSSPRVGVKRRSGRGNQGVAHDPMARCCATLTGHTAQVASVAFAPDGSLLASGSGDSNGSGYGARTDGGLERIATGHDAFRRHQRGVLAGRATAGIGQRGRSGETLAHRGRRAGAHHPGACWRSCAAFAFSPSGQPTGDGERRRHGQALAGRGRQCCSARFITRTRVMCPMSCLLARRERCWRRRARTGQVKVWRVADWRAGARPRQGHTAPVTSVAFSPNGRLIASGSADASCQALARLRRAARSATLAGHT